MTCRLINNMVWATEMKPTMTFYIFRQHIVPKWEDDINRNGGKFLWEFTKPPAELNGTWINLVRPLSSSTAALTFAVAAAGARWRDALGRA